MHWGDCNRYFANVAGVGLTGKVAHFARPMRRLFPRLRYTLALLRCLGGAFNTEEIEVSLDVSDRAASALEKQVLMLSIAIGTREGSVQTAARAKPEIEIIWRLLVDRHLGEAIVEECVKHFVGC